MNNNEVRHNFERILVGVDDSPDAQLAYRYAVRQARDTGATLILTTILENEDMSVFQALDKNHIHDERNEIMKHLNDYKNLAERAGVKKVEMVVDEGDAGETIVNSVIPATDADLLIIGSMSTKDLKKMFGSQAAYMSKHSPISVMVVR